MTTFAPNDPREGLRAMLGQLAFAREYMLAMLADLKDDDWFAMPNGATTHIAWQVGHIAMAEYGLCLFRQRGRQTIDLELMPSKLRKLYARGSAVNPDPVANPTPNELREALDRIHRQVLLEAPAFTAEQLMEPTDMPYAGPPTKLGALLFCPIHEGIHTGQIGMLRRGLGRAPLR